METNTKHSVLSMLKERDLVKICAPMVRYSKLPFRLLVRKFGCDVAYTPMIIAESFVASPKARDSEFTVSLEDRPLITQFAANRAEDLASAALLVYPFSDGVDLNCGCPQRWAIQEGYGACLLRHPELLCDMVRQTRSRVNDPDFSVSIKIRLHSDLRETVELCRRAEAMGASWITVHGRTPLQRTEPVNTEAIRLIADSVSLPVVANGDVTTLDDALSLVDTCHVKGVMAARGLLSNPALFAGHNQVPIECISEWVDVALQTGTPFITFHNHLIYMMEHLLTRSERRLFNCLTSTAAVVDYLRTNFDI